MAKYVDHGAYGACVVTGYICSVNGAYNATAGSFLTVTAVTSGIIGVGSQITGAGIPDGIYISAYNTGTNGGVGCYTISNAITGTASLAIASTTLTGKYALPLTTPLTWGQAQDGDGTASDATAVSATVSIDLSAATAAAGATVSIMGATLTCVASGATTNQFNAGSGATLVSNLVTAINRTTNTSAVTAQATNWYTHKIQDIVFARVGTPTTTLQIMTRAGSAQFNTSQVTTSGFTGGTFGPYTFSGGVGGCWGLLFNQMGAAFPSGIASNGYGVWCQFGTLAGHPDNGETIYIRSGKLIYTQRNQTGGYSVRSTFGSVALPVRLLVDDSTIWSDGAYPVLEIQHYTNSNSSMAWNPNLARIELRGKRYSAGNANLRFYEGGAGSNLKTLNFYTSANAAFRSIDVIANGGAGGVTENNQNGASSPTTFTDIVFEWATERTSHGCVSLGSNSTWRAVFTGCTFRVTTPSAPQTAAIIGIGSGQVSSMDFYNCKFEGWLTGSVLAGNSSADQPIFFYNCDFGNTNRGPTMLQKGVGGVAAMNSRAICGYSDTGYNEFFIDSAYGYAEWNYSAGYPKLNAVLLDGVTPWSIRLKPPVSATVAFNSPFVSPAFIKYNSLSDGVRTLTLELLIDNTLSFTTRDVGLLVDYIDTTGKRISLESQDNSGAALTTSTAAWTSTLWSGITHNKYKISLTTPTAIKTGTPITCKVAIYSNVVDTTKNLFFDPEITVA